MKNNKINNRTTCLFFCLCIMFSFVFTTTVKANNITEQEIYNFGQEKYSIYCQLDKLINKILYESNKQQILYFKIITKWNIYNTKKEERINDVKDYINKTKEQYLSIGQYKSPIQHTINSIYKEYITKLETLVLEDTDLFYDNTVVFLNYATLNEEIYYWYTVYSIFKENIMINFENKYIFNDLNLEGVKKIQSNNIDEQKQGKKIIRDTVQILTKIKNNKDTYNIIKGYCNNAINQYNNLLKGKNVDIENIFEGKRYWINGLIVMAPLFDEIEEFNFYVMKFNSFSDYPSKDLSLKIKPKTLNNHIQMLNNTPVTQQSIIELKRKHYKLICEIANYKNKKPNNIDKTYVDFFNSYKFLDKYYASIRKQYGVELNPQNIQKEIQIYNNKISCFGEKIDDSYKNISYKQKINPDTTKYNYLTIKESRNINKLLLISLITIIISFIIYILILNYRDKNNNFYY